MNPLRVYLFEHEAGILEESVGGALSFRYSSDWLKNPQSPGLSRALPLQKDDHNDTSVRAFFSGLLPEGTPRSQVAANLGLSEENDYGLLTALGGDCAGAVRLVPLESKPSAEVPQILTKESLASYVQELPRRPLLAGKEGVRLSLAGAQSKLPLRMIGEKISLSSFHYPSTHILKPESPNFEGLAAVEYFSLLFAKRIGLNVVNAQILNLADTPCLLVERYDRFSEAESQIKRIHQEDFCQALAIPPHRKYQQEGGPSVAESLEMIRTWSSRPVLDIRQFLETLIYNVLLGNADAHGKNFSWLYPNGKRQLAPQYDLVATTLWSELSTRMAMRIGQAKYINEVTSDHFLKMAGQNQVGKAILKNVLADICQKARSELQYSLANVPTLTGEFRHQLHTEISDRISKLS